MEVNNDVKSLVYVINNNKKSTSDGYFWKKNKNQKFVKTCLYF